MSSEYPSLLSGVAQAVLEELAEYRYLTVKQMLRLKVAKDRGHLGKVLASLQRPGTAEQTKERRPKEIGALDFGVKVGKGRLPRLYYLTRQGAALLAAADPYYTDLYVPERVTFFASDYEHRIGTIDFHIALRLWEADHNGHEGVRFWRYFDWTRARTGNAPAPLTRLRVKGGTITPDMIFTLSDAAGIKRQYCFEYANGRDTKRVVGQLQAYAAALDNGSLNRSMGVADDIAVRILIVFASPSLFEHVCARASVNNLIKAYTPHFYMTRAADYDEKNIGQGWCYVTAKEKHRSLWE